ncbi:DUF3540 domain-containing protein [Variovorax sp. ZS18.2.2]|uniref:DUF3540 domain-containing protein n=1 Tax=Variovorax sp. ZS18.2.2 TaxID=2971255 RepID=UPI002151AD6A|nr:DUF3540 domain-containing protein [Variovorax sp. ZS18.2.2]MCR6478561.1 DUF3540 domain-containing protein [Variovorax sp. ZS18.2.2]
MNTVASHAAVATHRGRRPTAARPQPAASPACWSAHVEACGDAALRVNDGAQSFEVRRAASCLLLPAPGDQVACVRTGPQEVWVLAVLQRAADTPAVLHCDGALEIKATTLRLRSERLDVVAEHAVLTVGVAELIGRQLRAVATTVKIVGSVLTSVMDRVTHFSRQYQRTTKGTDRVSAIHIECEAEQLLRMQAEHVLANGSKLVKTRGAQIHFG